MTDPREILARTRRTPGLRRLVRETRLSPAELVLPVFAAEREEDAGPIPSLPGVERHALSAVGGLARRAHDAGLGGLILFGVPATKDARGTTASDAGGVVCRALRAAREAAPGLPLVADVCLCQFTDHGHCGVPGVAGSGAIDRGRTLDRYAESAAAYADAGADLVAPSGMIDGQVRTIRDALDDRGHERIAIMSYAVKHASAFYGPFRDAAGSAPAEGGRASHQMDPANAREALREAAQDEEEGADVLMVKPAMTNLDTLCRLRDATDLPLAAYHVSGEHAALAIAAERGLLDRRAATLESLTAIKRAGASIIITYAALETAEWLRTAAP